MTKHILIKRWILGVVFLIVAFVITNVALVLSAGWSMQDDANQAAFNAANAVQNSPITQDTAERARGVAAAYLAEHGEKLTGDFRLGNDGSVTLTIARTSPAVLIDQIGPTKHFTQLRATATSKGQQE